MANTQTYISSGTPTVGSTQAQTIEIRDISKGRISLSAVGNGLVPPNSVANCLNVDFDQIVGQGVVRDGSTRYDNAPSAGFPCLGMYEFVANGGDLNYLVSVFPTGGTATLFYNGSGSWAPSLLNTVSSTSKANFAMLGNSIFFANGANAMSSSVNGYAWGQDDCIVPTQTLTVSQNGTTTTGIYQPGETVTGNVSGATGKVIAQSSPSVSTVSLVLYDVTGTFTSSDTVITGSISGATGSFVSFTDPTDVIPFLLLTAKSRMIAAATTPNRDRVYFSSIIDPTQTPFITWNTDPLTGDWIDIDPDNGQNITAFLNLSNQVVVFKERTMYRLNVISATVDTDNVYNIGAVSQNAVTSCQGLGYFYSGDSIYSTDGTAPQQLSRAGVDDFLSAIPPQSQSSVTMGADENNVFCSIGTVTVNGVQFQNVVLKFSVRDGSWSIRSYPKQFLAFSNYTPPTNTGRSLFGGTNQGDVVQLDYGTTDDGVPIFFSVDTQELDCNNRAHVKSISDEIVVFTKNGQGSQVYSSSDGKDFVPVEGTLEGRVNVLDAVDIEFRFLTLRWTGTSSGQPPVLEGFQVENVVDEGTQSKQD